jgi:hypothetical protein
MLAGHEINLDSGRQVSPAPVVASLHRERRSGRADQGNPAGVGAHDIIVGQHHVMVEDPFEVVEHLVCELHRDAGFDQAQLQRVLPEEREPLIGSSCESSSSERLRPLPGLLYGPLFTGVQIFLVIAGWSSCRFKTSLNLIADHVSETSSVILLASERRHVQDTAYPWAPRIGVFRACGQ